MHLFTPVGERLWLEGWDPVFPAGEHEDGAAPGTVFLTERPDGDVVWVVVDRGDLYVRYARVTPGLWAGIVEVRLAPAGDNATEAQVTYDMTPLGDAGRAELESLSEGYGDLLAAWERLIAAAIAAGSVPRD